MITHIDNDLLSTKVFNALKEAMIDGRLRAGEKTTETRLADMLGVSRTPVREALKLLSAQGYVTLIKNSGVIINEFTLDDYRDQFAVRCVLEGLSARLAAQKITPEQAKKLKASFKDIEDMREAGGHYDGWAFMRVDMRFHEVVHEIAGNKRVMSIENPMQERMNWIYANIISVTQEVSVEYCYAHHKGIMEAILAHDAETAERIAREHPMFVFRILDDIDPAELQVIYKDIMDTILAREPERAEQIAREYPSFIFRILDAMDPKAVDERVREQRGKNTAGGKR